MAQLDDITLEIEPVNVPTTSDEYPNWRRRYAVQLEGSRGRLAPAPYRRSNERGEAKMMTSDEIPSWGAQVLPDDRVQFALWAPAAHRVSLSVQGLSTLLPMTRDPDGWHQLVTDQVAPGSLYEFVLPNGSTVPDPASRFQPQDVTGPSEVIDPASYSWKQPDWRGRPWHEAVVYELHVGTFTAEGTFQAVIEKLPYLRDLGVTALEIMPVGDFPGSRNWGYDGVFWYAPESSYGRPEDFKALIDAAHGFGLMVLLDVIYNHFGPEGNFLSTYAPDFFTERHKTPWGAGINYDGDNSAAVRAFATDNALYWLQEFRLDGLRLDAVHAIKDDSSKHLLQETRGARQVRDHRSANSFTARERRERYAVARA